MMSQVLPKIESTQNWTRECVYHDGDAFFQALLTAMAEAQSTIDFETYIFDIDSLGLKVINALKEAVGRGVRVRLLLDGVGCSQWNEDDLVPLKMSGVQIRIFHPLPWQRKRSRWWTWFRDIVNLRKLMLGFYKLNHRNHRKNCVIDGNTAFIGSMNVSSRHLISASGTAAWRDTSVQVQGPGVEALQEAFNADWISFERARVHPIRKRIRHWIHYVRLNSNPELRHAYRQTLLQKIREAKHRIWITNPYFVPDPELLAVLSQKAKERTDVRMILPRKIDFFGVRFAMQWFYDKLLRAGIRIFEYLPAILHAKTLIIDDWVSIGSSNLDHRSLFNDLEADVILSSPQSIDSVCHQFMSDLSLTRELSDEVWEQRSFFQRLFESLFHRFRTVL